MFRDSGSPATSLFMTHRYQEPKKSHSLFSKAIVFATPLILTIPTQTANWQLYHHVWHAVRALPFIAEQAINMEPKEDNLPFILKMVDSNGQCSACYAATCTGCIIPYDQKKTAKPSSMVAIEWSPACINADLLTSSNVGRFFNWLNKKGGNRF